MPHIMPALIGHRGLPSVAPENTQSCFIAAAESGIKWIETDVIMAGDGTLVMMHDPDLRLFKQPDVKLTDSTKKTLAQVDAGSWFNQTFKNEPLLFLAGALVIIEKLDLNLNLEIKINEDFDTSEQVDAVYKCLKEIEFPYQKLIVSSFNLEALARLRSLDSKINIAPLFEQIPEDVFNQITALKPVSVHCDQARLSAHQARALTAQYSVYCFTVNDVDTAMKLVNWGIAGIFSDRADAAELRHLFDSVD